MQSDTAKNEPDDMIQKIHLFLLGFILALGPVFWFWGIGKIIVIKAICMSVLFLYYSKTLLKSRFFFLCAFVLFIFLYAFSMHDYKDDFKSRFLFLYLDLIIAWGFLCIGDSISFPELCSVIRIACICCIGYCIIFWFCYLTGLISYCPCVEYYLTNGTVKTLPFTETGWGFGRTQWSTCISVFIPAMMIWLPQPAQKKVYWNKIIISLGVFLILSVQMVSGGRGGIIASVSALLFCLYFIVKKKRNFLFLSACMLLVFFYIVHANYYYYRMDQINLSQSRSEQWSVCWEIMMKLPFWGFGDYGNASVMERFGIPYAFHDSFLRYLFGFGFAGFCEGIFILALLICGFQTVLKQKQNQYVIAVAGVLLSGFISTFFEPNPIFVAYYWPMWWICAGFLYHHLEITSKYRGEMLQERML